MKNLLRIAIMVLTIGYAAELCAADYYSGQQDPSKTGISSDRALLLYGKVVDQHGRPVYKASITGGKEYLDTNRIRFFGIETVRTETDTQGNFTFSGLMLKKLYIKEIEKRGFETLRNESGIRTFSYDEGSQEPLFKPDPAKPVIFVLQKKFDAGLVDLRKTRMLLWHGMEGFTINLFKGFSSGMEKIPPEKNSEDIRVSFTTTPDAYRMEVRAFGTHAGLLDKDGKPHIAPETGYARLLVYQFPKSGQFKAVMYHRGGAGKIYSRLELDLTPVKSGLRVAGGLFTNIAGERNTDFDSFHTEEQIVRLTGKKISYGGSSYRQEVRAILENTIQ